MPLEVTHLLQRIPEGRPLQVRIEREMAWIEEGADRCTQFPVRSMENPAMEGTYDAALEVAQAGRFLTAEEIGTRPLKGWLACQDAAVRLVLNRGPQGGPLTTAPFDLEGIEIVVRPSLPLAPSGRAVKMACLLPCREVRLYTCATGQDWKVATMRRGADLPSADHLPKEDPPPIRDRFIEIAAIIPTRPSAQPYGCGGEGARKPGEDWEEFRMGTSPPTPSPKGKGA